MPLILLLVSGCATLPARIRGFPYLRVNRFLASFADELDDESAFAAWVTRLRALDRQGRDIELALLDAGTGTAQPTRADVAACADRMLAVDMASPSRRALLRARARVPGDYRTVARIAGAYPAAVPFLKIGVARWQARTHAVFDAAPAGAPVVTYAPGACRAPPTQQIAAWLTAARRRDPLGIPELAPDRLRAVARRYAPVFRIETAAAYDRPGRPYRGPTGLNVDAPRPLVYLQPAYTRFEGRVPILFV